MDALPNSYTQLSSAAFLADGLELGPSMSGKEDLPDSRQLAEEGGKRHHDRSSHGSALTGEVDASNVGVTLAWKF